MAKKKKKEPKVEKVFDEKGKIEEQTEEQISENQQPEEALSDIDDFLGKQEEAPEDNLSERQRKKLEKLCHFL